MQNMSVQKQWGRHSTLDIVRLDLQEISVNRT